MAHEPSEHAVPDASVPGPRTTFGTARAEDELGCSRHDRVHDPGQLLRIEGAVTVHEGHDLGVGRGEPGEARGTEPATGLDNDLGAELTSDGRGSVGRAVVDHDRSEAGRHPLEDARQRGGLVEHREHQVGHGSYGSHGAGRSAPRAPYDSRNSAARGEKGAETRRYSLDVPVTAEVPVSGASRRAAPRRSTLFATAGALALWGALVLVARLWGDHLIHTLGRDQLRLSAPPLVGWDDWRVGVRVVVPLVVGAGVVLAAPSVVRRLPWRQLLVVAALAAALWAVALAVTDGVDGITRPTVLRGDEYLLDVDLVGSPGSFLADFTDRVDEFSTHVRSHPPGMVLTLWSLDRVGLGGQGWAAALMIAGGAAAIPAVLVAVREVAGESNARRAAPFLVVAPAAIWVATSADAFYAGVSAWAVTLVVLATGRPRARSDAYAFAGGLLFGGALMLSYGLMLVALIPATVAVARRRFRPVAVAVVGAALVLGAFWLAGFSYLDGLSTTRAEYAESVASTRPYSYFVLANLAALAIATGPATAVALSRLRDGRLWLLVGGALAAVVLADVSGLSKGEVERIWLPLTVWILAAGAALGGAGYEPGAAVEPGPVRTRGWLGLQAGVALLVQVGIRTRW